METDDMRRYLLANFRPDDRLAVVLINKRTRSEIQRLTTAETLPEPECQEWLRHQNAQGYEVYLSMNALTPTAMGRTKADVAAIRHIYLDFDTDGTTAVNGLPKRDDLPRPNYLLNTSPDKWQVLWKVEGFEQRHGEALQRGFARETDADSAATDCTRVLRFPGFYNHKYSRLYLVRAEPLACETNRPEHFPEISEEKRAGHRHQGTRPSARPRSRPPGTLSQFRTRLVIRQTRAGARRVAGACRRCDCKLPEVRKHNPRDYAETVQRAGEALRTEATRDLTLRPARN